MLTGQFQSRYTSSTGPVVTKLDRMLYGRSTGKFDTKHSYNTSNNSVNNSTTRLFESESQTMSNLPLS